MSKEFDKSVDLMNEAFAIVRAIAASDPEGTIDYGSGSEQTGSWGITGCVYCREERMGWSGDWKHKPDCTWARAVRWASNLGDDGEVTT